MTSTVDFSLFTSLFSHSTFFGLSWFVALLITMISLPVITTDPEKWKTLFFPVALCWLIAGVNVHVIMLIIGMLIFAQESIGLQTIGNVARSASDVIRHTTHNIRYTTAQRQAKFKAEVDEFKRIKRKIRNARAREVTIEGEKVPLIGAQIQDKTNLLDRWQPEYKGGNKPYKDIWPNIRGAAKYWKEEIIMPKENNAKELRFFKSWKIQRKIPKKENRADYFKNWEITRRKE